MHFRWKTWQKEAAEDSALDRELDSKRQQRKKALIDIYTQQYYLAREEQVLNGIRAQLFELRRKYAQLDYDLAMIDGRFQVIPENKKPIKDPDNLKKTIAKMSKSEKMKLLKELGVV